MLDEEAQELAVITSVPRIDICSAGDGLTFQDPPSWQIFEAASRDAVVTPPDSVGGLGPHDFIAQQFSLPEGICGRVAGVVMGLINYLPNKQAIERLDIAKRDDVLEIGFGPGWALKAMSRLAHGGTITGVDRSPAMVRLAQARIGSRSAMES